jgi:hypothetical protein
MPLLRLAVLVTILLIQNSSHKFLVNLYSSDVLRFDNAYRISCEQLIADLCALGVHVACRIELHCETESSDSLNCVENMQQH